MSWLLHAQGAGGILLLTRRNIVTLMILGLIQPYSDQAALASIQKEMIIALLKPMRSTHVRPHHLRRRFNILRS